MQLIPQSRSSALPVLWTALGLALFALSGCQPAAEETPGPAAGETSVPAAVEVSAAAELDQPEEQEPAVEVEVTGQTFLVLPGGESLRLGSVRLQAFAETTIREHLARREEQVALRRAELEAGVAELAARADKALAARAAAEEAYRTRETEIRNVLTAYVAELEARKAGWQSQIDSNRTFIDSVDQLPPPPAGVPSPEENEEYEERRKQWLSMTRDERVNWGTVLTSLNEDLQLAMANLANEREDKVFAFADELQALDETIAAREASLVELRASADKARQGLAEFPGDAEYLSGMPSPLEERRSDADGEFAFTLLSDRAYALFAETSRVVDGKRETFRWLVAVRPGDRRGARVILSNHNLLGSDAPENLFVFPAEQAPSET